MVDEQRLIFVVLAKPICLTLQTAVIDYAIDMIQSKQVLIRFRNQLSLGDTQGRSSFHFQIQMLAIRFIHSFILASSRIAFLVGLVVQLLRSIEVRLCIFVQLVVGLLLFSSLLFYVDLQMQLLSTAKAYRKSRAGRTAEDLSLGRTTRCASIPWALEYRGFSMFSFSTCTLLSLTSQSIGLKGSIPVPNGTRRIKMLIQLDYIPTSPRTFFFFQFD